jgi:GTP diphosphokinase / guanosine-3',5'-bis(diphosphate) 3'-diphosphatase
MSRSGPHAPGDGGRQDRGERQSVLVGSFVGQPGAPVDADEPGTEPRHRLLSDVTRALADERVNVLSASVQTSRDRVVISRFTFELADPGLLGSVLQTVRNIDGVFDVERVSS